MIVKMCSSIPLVSLTVLQHGHDVLFDHWQNDFSSQTTGNSVQSTFPGYSVTVGNKQRYKSF